MYTIYKQIPSKINVPATMLDLLKGTNDLWLQNNVFVVADTNSKYLKEMLKTNIIHGKQDALQIKAPMLYVKNDKTGQFTKNFRLELTSKLANKETYRFSRPGEMCYPSKMAKRKNVIRTKIMDREAEMNAMIAIDNIIYMTLEYLILATFANYDFSKCTSDQELITGLFKAISPKHYETLMAMLSDKYYTLTSKPPLWEKDENVNGNFKIVNEDEDDNKHMSLFNLIYATRAGDKKKTTPNSCQEDIVNNLFKGKTKGNVLYDFIMATASNDIVPMCKRVNYEIDDGYKMLDELRLTWFVKEVKAPDYNPNFPSSMYTKEIKRGGRSDPIIGKDFMAMIGYGDVDEQATYYKGFLWVNNRLDLVKYDKHQVHISWVVSEYILAKTDNAKAKFQVEDDYFNDDDEEKTLDDSQQVNEAKPMQNFKSAEELAAEFEDDD